MDEIRIDSLKDNDPQMYVIYIRMKYQTFTWNINKTFQKPKVYICLKLFINLLLTEV